MNNLYTSTFQTSAKTELLLRTGKMIDEHETPRDMVTRIVSALGTQELAFNTDETQAKAYITRFGELLDDCSIVMSTPIITNSGRHDNRPLSACIMPPISLLSDLKLIRTKIDDLHQQGMGTGFNLSDIDNPVEILRALNNIALNGSQSGLEERPVGNMATMSVYHPDIIDFIMVKKHAARDNNPWKFNISVDLDEAFFDALEAGVDITLRDGTHVAAAEIFQNICEAAHLSGDPGVIFLERMNQRNPVPGLGTYKTTAPCAEVGLTEGEACQFGYLNVAAFITHFDDGATLDAINFDKLKEATALLTRFLDNALEISIANYSAPETKAIMTAKRKIGVGLCGVADALTKLGLPYSSQRSREIMKNIMAFINYQSKLASIQLARERGSCRAMDMLPGQGNRYYDSRAGFLTELYGNGTAEVVTAAQWKALDKQIARDGLLRNTSTVALPPTGRSALVISASPGIEPHFSLKDLDETVCGTADTFLSNGQHDAAFKQAYLATAKDIAPDDHIAMTASFQMYTDEAISKTINLPKNTPIDKVAHTYLSAWRSNLNGATLYVDDTHKLQPRSL